MINKTISEIRDDIIKAIKARIPFLDLTEGTPERDIFVEAPIAGKLITLWNKLIYAAKLHAPILYYQDLEEGDVNNYCANYNVLPIPATYSRGTVTFYTATAPATDVLITNGTIVTTLDSTSIEFEVEGNYVMYVSSIANYWNSLKNRYEIQCTVAARLAGASYKATANSVVRIKKAISGIDGCTNPDIISGGTDADTVGERVKRVVEKFQGKNIASSAGLSSYLKGQTPVVNIVGAKDPEMLRDDGLGGCIDIYTKGTDPTTVTEIIDVATIDENLMIEMAPITVVKGAQYQLTTTITPVAATNQMIHWTSSNTAVAQVSSTGLITAVDFGNATITAVTVNGQKTTTCIITVVDIPITSIELNYEEYALSIGDTLQLAATAIPADTTHTIITWLTSNAEAATVSTTGLVTAVTSGSVIITALSDDSKISASCKLTISAILVEEVVLTKSETAVIIGNSETLFAHTVPRNATNSGIRWVSSDTAIATVSTSGIVTPLTPGTVSISAVSMEGNKVAHCSTHIVQASHANNLTSPGVTLTENIVNLNTGDTHQFVPVFHVVDPGSPATNQQLIWSCANTAIASLDASGYLIAKSAGGATIICTSVENPAYQAMCTVTVADIAVTSVALSDSAKTLKIGDSHQLYTMVAPTNATNKNVAWLSTDTGIATVSQTGLITAVSEGTVNIIVTTQNGGKVAVCEVQVEPIEITSITLNKTATALAVGGYEQLSTLIAPINATYRTITWVSSNPSVITVDSGGLIHAVAEGTATVTARTQDVTKFRSCAVTVASSDIDVTNVYFKATTDTLILENQPVSSIQTVLVNNIALATTYFRLVKDTGILKGSTAAFDKLQLTDAGLTALGGFKIGDRVETTYLYNKLLHTIQDSLYSPGNLYVNRDYLVREMTPITIDVTLYIKPAAGYTIAAVTPTVSIVIDNLISSIKNNDSVETADIIGGVKNLPGVDNIDLTRASQMLFCSGGGVKTTQGDITIGKNEYPITGTVTILLWE